MRLNRDTLTQGTTLPTALPVNTMAELPEKVIQFGEGNFLRAFVDWMIDRLNEAGRFNGRVVVVQPIANGLIEALNDQDGLYTLLLRGIEKGQVAEQRRLITALSRGVNPYTDWQAYLACAENPELRFVVSNTTEAGIAYAPEDFVPGAVLNSYPAKLTALLYHRFTCFDGDPTKGLLILPCELIDKNGRHLREIVLKLIADWELSEAFRSWVLGHNHFFNTLVDRIVTGYPRAEAEKICAELGYTDRLLDTGEIFHLWVIEGETRFKDELPLHEIGLNVIWTDDLTPYRERKVRVLNGAHTLTVAVAHLAGLATVRAASEDPLVGDFMQRGIFEEILPFVRLPEAEKRAFAESVLERFENPFIEHRWLDISLNSISKFKTRCLPTLTDYVDRHQSPPPLMSFSLAALICFYRGSRIEAGRLLATGPEGPYEVKDDAQVLEFFRSAWQSHGDARPADGEALACKVLGEEAFWGTDLNALPGLTAAVATALGRLQRDGLRSALARALNP
jgi:tagaturonate reductase